MSYFIAALKKYAVFSGRAQRKEFWYFGLFYCLLQILVMLLLSVLLVVSIKAGIGHGGWKWFFLGYQLFGLIFLVPFLAVTVRRLHDVGKCGWILFIGLFLMLGAQAIGVGMLFLMGIDIPGIPAESVARPLKLIVTFIGYLFTICYLVWTLWFFLIMITGSQPGFNKYGPNPIKKALAGSSRNHI